MCWCIVNALLKNESLEGEVVELCECVVVFTAIGNPFWIQTTTNDEDSIFLINYCRIYFIINFDGGDVFKGLDGVEVNQ